MTDLKRCPFCSGYAGMKYERFAGELDCFYVSCTICGARGQICNTEEEAAQRWNTRKKPYESRRKLPCPKCGSKRLSIWCSCDKDGNLIEAIACDNCKISSAWSHTTIGAIRDWNKVVQEWTE